jgi:hypothetical protein
VEVTRGFGDAAKALAATTESAGSIDAVVVALAGVPAASSGASTWETMLSEHRSIVEDLHTDASWARAAADYAAGVDRPVQLVTLTDATTSAGKSRAQAATQHARVAVSATEGRVTAFAVGIETSEEEAAEPAAELVAHLLTRPEAEALNGAELAIGAGWIGLRSHPRPTGSITFGGPGVPAWLDGVLREMVGNAGQAS